MVTPEERKVLFDEIVNLLEEYNYTPTDKGIDAILDEWTNNKGPLIELFKKHPNYIEGKFLIAFDYDYERPFNKSQMLEFSRYLCDVIVKLSDDIPQEMIDRRDSEGKKLLPHNLYEFLTGLKYFINEKTISDSTAGYLSGIIPRYNPKVGEKSTRVVNKICTYLGYDKDPDYNRQYAKFADSLSPMAIKRHTVISLNPLDFFTMSFGNSWASCHTIDKHNKRGMPGSYEGCYSSGTVSYMLDGTSMILYTVDSEYTGTDYWSQPKINRQMFHYANDKLVQSRLYPQSNDGFTDTYTTYRNMMQEIMAQILGVPNLWSLKRNNISDYISSYGTHYRDYDHYDSCTMSRIKGSDNEGCLEVGHRPICIECGYTHGDSESITCCSSYRDYMVCDDCGAEIDEDDGYWIDGNFYCGDCVSYCHECNEYVHESTTRVSNDYYVCDYCLEHEYTYCEICEEYVPNDEAVYVECDDIYVCDSCYDDNYDNCSVCGETYNHRDMVLNDNFDWVCKDCDKKEEEEENENE